METVNKLGYLKTYLLKDIFLWCRTLTWNVLTVICDCYFPRMTKEPSVLKFFFFNVFTLQCVSMAFCVCKPARTSLRTAFQWMYSLCSCNRNSVSSEKCVRSCGISYTMWCTVELCRKERKFEPGNLKVWCCSKQWEAFMRIGLPGFRVCRNKSEKQMFVGSFVVVVAETLSHVLVASLWFCFK